MLMEYQKTFISIISTHLPKDVKLVDFISEIIHIGKEASYRRIRCEVEFTLSEIIIIAKKLNINLNSIIISEGGNKTVFNLRLLPIEEYHESYVRRKKADLYLLEGFISGQCIISSINKSIPDELTFDMPYITKLKLLKNHFASTASIKQPLESITIPDNIKQVQQEYLNRISSVELIYFFDPMLFSPLVADIIFFSKLNLISIDEKKQLQKELYRLLDRLADIAVNGSYKEKQITLYVSYVTLDMSTLFIKDNNLKACIIDLSHNNSLLSFDPSVCKNQEESFTSLKKFTSLISQSGEIDRVIFFNKQRKIIEQLA